MYKEYIIYFCLIANIFALQVFAETPVVTSFITPSSINSGQIANIGWTIQGGGHSLIILCAPGIKLIDSVTNQVFPCDTRKSISPSASDGVSLYVANVSGSPRIITARIIPKDANGATDYDLGSKEATIYVSPSLEPISIFYSNATTTISGTPTTISWSSKYLDGVNFKIACSEFVTATSSIFGKGDMPCDRVIFPTDLSGNGSLTILFNNKASIAVPLDITILPAISSEMYNGIHTKTLTLMVASDAQKPITTSFTSSKTRIMSGDSIAFNWTLTNVSGTNIKFLCSPRLSLLQLSTVGTTTTPVVCGNFAWESPLLPSGSTSLSFFTSGEQDEVVTATIFPLLRNGTYDGSKAETIRIIVSLTAPKTAGIVETPVTVVTKLKTTAATSSSVATIEQKGKSVFKRALDIGSRGDDVTALQKYLSKDKSIYPEGFVTGYFGPSTKRAVGAFQIKYGLVKNNQDVAYGFVGQKTRAQLNTLQ